MSLELTKNRILSEPGGLAFPTIDEQRTWQELLGHIIDPLILGGGDKV